MIELKSKKDCCGCYACYNICPKQCIDMKQNKDGFVYPRINNKICINCNLCETVCPIINQYQIKNPIACYASKHKNLNIRLNSSSGGICYAFSEWTIYKDGIVFGASMDKELICKHTKAKSKKEITKFFGSKYIQSEIGDTYFQVKDYLEKNKVVLFIGTPCQISGLKHFLGKEYNNLYCIDFICHGVGNPAVLKSYINEIKKKYGNIQSLKFRNKKKNWKLCLNMIIDTKQGKKIIQNDKFLIGFQNNLYLRDCCYNCQFNQFRSGSDITVGDGWGIEVLYPKFDDSKGISTIMIKTEKGKELLNNIKTNIDIIPISLNHIIKFNPTVINSSKRNKKSKIFLEQFEHGITFKILSKKYIRPSISMISKHILGTKVVYWLWNKLI